VVKKLFVTIIVVGFLAMGYNQLRGYKIDFSSMRGKTVKIGRGDLTIPINATGEIGPLSRHQIKSEASGEVVEVGSYPGEMVKKGDLIIRLKKDEEQRSVDRATADVTRTEAALEQSQIRKRRLEEVVIPQARNQIEQIESRLALAEFRKNKIEGLAAGQASKEEQLTVQSNYNELVASLRSAEADLADAHIQVELAAADVVLSQAANHQAVTVLGDAKERLSETEIYSPVDGMLVQLNTQIGEVIQSGVTTYTAGTVLAVIADVSRLYVRTDVDESDIGAVRDLSSDWAKPGHDRLDEGEVPIETGTPVKVKVESFREEDFTGVIERIHPEPNSRASSVVTYRVDILLTSENRDKLLLGMQADVEFTAESVYDALLVPHDAIRRNDFDEMGVYIPVDDPNSEDRGKKFVKCRFGLDNGIYAEVHDSELSEGMEVYTIIPRTIGGDKDEDDD
jgi:HlyD family secretion protein